ncbi:O-antigen ligase family protein [Pseudomonas putida]|uniref:O-antigen ligase-related domain-containing protein n=1 Tax=Pseudomonas putida TaxID=303 RepID=A0A1X1A219_PSEPU|nr:O-antigen ligase family protein [Pseudomonas putida]ORL66219.1 hypothetical protein B7H17_05555 [Pseudomonas putida]
MRRFVFEHGCFVRVACLVLLVGFFIQVTGKIWIGSGSARNSQVYIWLLLPTLISLCFLRYFNISKFFCAADASWVLFLFWVGASAFWASGADRDAISLAKRGGLIALYILSIRLMILSNENYFRRVLLAAVATVALGALISLVNQYLILDRPLSYRAFRIDRSGIKDFANFGWPVAAGIFHGALSLWALGVAFDSKVSAKISAFWFSVFAVLAVYVYFTFTRGAWFALLAGSVAVVLFQNSKRGWGAFLVGGGLSLVALIFYWPQLMTEFSEKQLSGRGFIWAHYLSVMKGFWFFGHGLGTPFSYHWPGSNAVSPHAHSLYLQQIYDSGIVSLILLFSVLLVVFKKAWNFIGGKWVSLAMPPLIFALVAMLTDVERIFTRPGDYWTVFWMPVAIILAVSKRSSQ